MFFDNVVTIVCKHTRPQMATVRPNVLDVSEGTYKNSGVVIQKDVELQKIALIELLSSKPGQPEPELSAADAIVSVGLGIGSKENMKLIDKLAELLNAPVGASKLVVDMEWAKYNQQVGQTGKTVRPKIYIACGISGSTQHLVGIPSKNSKIIAINNNPNSPIHKIATISICEDVTEFVPVLTHFLEAMVVTSPNHAKSK